MENTQTDIFSHESSVSQSASGLMRIMVLQHLDSLFRNWRVYLVSKNQQDKAIFLSFASSLHSFILPVWERKDLKTSNKIQTLINEKEIADDEGNYIVDYFVKFLDDIELIKIDTKEHYDRTNFVKSNKHHGYT